MRDNSNGLTSLLAVEPDEIVQQVDSEMFLRLMLATRRRANQQGGMDVDRQLPGGFGTPANPLDLTGIPE
jgi:hypothetical protein